MRLQAVMSEFASICEARGIEPQELHDGIFYATLNPEAATRVCYIGGIHGDEEGGTVSTLRFLETTTTDVGVVLLPVWNLKGFDRNKRRDGHKDPNRQWCHDLGEAEKKLVKLVSRCKFLHTLHEDSREEFYLYYSQYGDRSTFMDLVKLASKVFPILDQKKVYGDKLDAGMISQSNPRSRKHRCSVEYFFEQRGIPYLTTETPGLADLDARAECGRLAMEWVAQNLEKILR